MKQCTDAVNTAQKSTVVNKEQPKKPVKNLYEPYATPRIAYELLRFLARAAFFLIFRTRIRGAIIFPEKDPILLPPTIFPGRISLWLHSMCQAKWSIWQRRRLLAGRLVGSHVFWVLSLSNVVRLIQAMRAAQELLKRKKVLVSSPKVLVAKHTR